MTSVEQDLYKLKDKYILANALCVDHKSKFGYYKPPIGTFPKPKCDYPSDMKYAVVVFLAPLCCILKNC